MKEKKVNFKVPEDYFDSIETHLFAKLAEENLPKSSGFTVPQNYLESVEDRVIKALPSKVISFSTRIGIISTTLAACLVIGWFLMPRKTLETIETVQLSFIDKYIEDGNLDVNVYDFAYYLEDEDLLYWEEEAGGISDAAIEDYLKENNHDIYRSMSFPK